MHKPCSPSLHLPGYLPLFDPDSFYEATFFQAIEQIGYKTIMLGGTGNAKMHRAVENIRQNTNLAIVIHPASPGDVLPADLIVLGAVINTNSHYTRPFGSGAIAISNAIWEQRIPYLPTAYFVMAESTAQWYTDAFLVKSEKLVLSYCLYASMVDYKAIHLDYESDTPSCVGLESKMKLIQKIKKVSGTHLIMTDTFTPQLAAFALASGVDTAISASDIYEQHSNPIELAKAFYEQTVQHMHVRSAAQVQPALSNSVKANSAETDEAVRQSHEVLTVPTL